jgi:hypothetical protein
MSENVFIVKDIPTHSLTKTNRQSNIKDNRMLPIKDSQSVIKVATLAEDNNYFSNVFKKTERLVSVTFYIVSEIERTERTTPHLEAIKDKGFLLHETALRSLSIGAASARELRSLQLALLALESTLRVAVAAVVITPEVFSMIEVEVDNVQRHLRQHYMKDSGFVLAPIATEPPAPAKSSPANAARNTTRRSPRSAIPAGDISTDAYLVYSQLTDRKERIKTVLEAKPEATIKDIAEVITDVSEKTIQRELNSLIEKGHVVRQGERRWSKYSLK